MLAAPVLGASLAAGCGATEHSAAPARTTPVADAQCLGGPAAPAITANTLGVFHGGPLTLVLYRDPAQVSLAELARDGKGLGAYATVTGRRPVTLRVDTGSRRRLGLQFTAMSGYGPGLSAVRFSPCPGRETIGGGLAVHSGGCVHLHVSAPTMGPRPLLLALGNSLAGCPPSGRAALLPSASFPYLGIACPIGNRAGCQRIRVGVSLARPALLVVVQVDGRLASLSPPSQPGSHLWQGVVYGMGPRHGPLAVRARHGHWYGEPPVHPRVRVTAYFADGTAATRAGVGYLHAGYG